MSQMTNGQKESDYVDQKWYEVNKLLDDYYNKLGLNIVENDNVSKIINLKEIEINSLDSDTCGTYSILLMHYSIFLQNQLNRHLSKKNWAENNLNVIVGKQASNYGDKFTKWEEKKSMVIADNSYANALNKIIIITTAILDEGSFISKKIEYLAHFYSELQKGRKKWQ